jgi:AAA+ ATPase superfamily predicted ATPase
LEDALKFANRNEEMNLLKELYEEKPFQFIVIYGRRRVGKTRLVQEFIRDKPAVYFLADSISESEPLKILGRDVGDFFNDPILRDSGFKDWYQFFKYLKDRAAKRFILVIDEFPYLVNANAAISSIFQKGIDSYLKDSNLFLVLLGSSIGMMEREVLFYKAPLYGRRTASLEVKEIVFDSLRDFFPEMGFERRVEIYSVMGAIPAYIEKINPNVGIYQNMLSLILNRGSFLYNEVEFLLREELREPRNYFVILRSIAQGKRKLSEIINDTGFEKSHLSRYLDILRSIRLIEKEIPVTEKYPEKSRLGLYKLHDRYFAFWFKYVFPNRGRLEIGNTDYVINKIKESFDQHVSIVYEDICKGLCFRLMGEGRIQFTAIGKWWMRNQEIDLVALDEEEKTIYFAECKWSSRKVGEDVFSDLVSKSSLVDWNIGKRKERYILFSKKGFTESMQKLAKEKDVLLVEGENMPL